jgi:hypothetical protein
MVPIVHAKLLETLAVKAILGLVPLQVVAVVLLVIDGAGFMVTVIVVGFPTQLPVVEVGVTIYCTLPFVIFGLLNT